MIRGVANDGGLARAAIEAALRAQSDATASVSDRVAGNLGLDQAGGAEKPGADFAGKLMDGLRGVQAAASAVERLPAEMATGAVTDFAELAARLKQSELTFKFSMEVRNKLIDAYRETMRMSV
jgi:flagellar hook-basal body complex protein FliE